MVCPWHLALYTGHQIMEGDVFLEHHGVFITYEVMEDGVSPAPRSIYWTPENGAERGRDEMGK